MSTTPEFEKAVHQLFEAQVAETPDAIALIYEEQNLSYRDLNAKANRLAQYLRNRGVAPESRVAVCIERSAEMIVALLATLKAGGAYVPLDPTYPSERLAYMINDTAPVLVLTNNAACSGLQSGSQGVRIVNLDSDAAEWAQFAAADPDHEAIGLHPQNVAYIIYTSGSTGAP